MMVETRCRLTVKELSSLLLALFFIACTPRTSHKEEIVTEKTKIDEVKSDTFGSISEIQFEYDIEFNGIELINSSSLLGKIEKPIFIEEDGEDFAKLIIYNKAGTQKLSLFLYPGSAQNEVSYFKLESGESGERISGLNVFQIDDASFLTNNGFSLGYSGSDLRKKYSNGNIQLTEQRKGSRLVLSHIVDNHDSNWLLKKYNMPLYIAKYQLENDIINSIEFGFEYP